MVSSQVWLCIGGLFASGVLALCGVVLISTIIFAPQGFLVCCGAAVSALLFVTAWSKAGDK
jgi:hypothetical protein